MRREGERKYIGGRREGRDGQLRMEGRTGVRQSERVVFKGRKENPKLHALPVVAEFKGTWSIKNIPTEKQLSKTVFLSAMRGVLQAQTRHMFQSRA